MATERLPMRKIREILRLRRQQGLSVRESARALGVSVGVVSKTSSRAEKAGISWEVSVSRLMGPVADKIASLMPKTAYSRPMTCSTPFVCTRARSNVSSRKRFSACAEASVEASC
jgi:hypothetical protein